MEADSTALRLALHRAWDEISRRTFLLRGKGTLSAEEVREAVFERLAAEPVTNPNVRAFWAELSDEGKRRALAEAFPHGPYPAPVDDSGDEIRSDGLTD